MTGRGTLLPLIFGTILALVQSLWAQTQAQQNQDACGAYKTADQALNATYSRVLKDYAKDVQFLPKLRAAQRAWLAFRDAHLDALYPAVDTQAEYGSVYPTCRCAALKELTEQRTRQLIRWLDGKPEG